MPSFQTPADDRRLKILLETTKLLVALAAFCAQRDIVCTSTAVARPVSEKSA